MLDKGKLRTFVLGGIAGAAVGILLSPKSGKELRGSIASRAGEARERGRETYFEAQELARERLAEARDRPPSVPRTDESGTAPEGTLSPQPLPNLGGGVEGPAAGPPPLRDVSRGAPGDPPGPPRGDSDQEELRRRIRETRSRLRELLEDRGPEGLDG